MRARFTPRHMVSYQGEFYGAGEELEIDPADAEEMGGYGTVELEEDPGEEEFTGPELPKRRRRG